MDISEDVPVVIDNGSNSIKACFAGDKSVRAEFPCLVGNQRHSGVIVGMGQPHPYAGDELKQWHKVLSIRHPMERGLVVNWDAMEYIWHHTFYNELRVAPEEHPVLLSESPDSPKINREKTTEIMFESFNSPSLYLSNSAALSLYSAGLSTGLVVESGYEISRAVPVFRWHSLSSCASKLHIAGKDLDDYLMQLLVQSGCHSFNCGWNREVLTDIKEKVCYVALNIDKEMLKDSLRSYELPDGKIIQICDQRFRCLELFFQPKLIGNESAGIHELAHESVLKCDAEIQKHLYGNILLSGGSTSFPGMSVRLERELGLLNNSTTSTEVRAPLERKYSVCMGGSMLASTSVFNGMCLLKSVYDEHGPAIIHKKCF